VTPAVRAQALAAMTSLQVLQVSSAGVDAFLDQRPAGVTVCDGRGAHSSATSEWVLAAILSMLRDFPFYGLAQQRSEWSPHRTDDLAGKSVLVIGAGDVGEQLARRLRACDAAVVLVGRRARAGVHATSEIATLLPEADIVVLLVPLTPETTGLVDAAFLARMADGALFVNAARGPVVDTEALTAELVSGRLRAALDVTDPEPLPADHVLWTRPNVLITPHIGGFVRSAATRVSELLIAQIRRLDAGRPLANVVEGDY
jgi:phosphoglycerate dehydrogenase-like enzyme